MLNYSQCLQLHLVLIWLDTTANLTEGHTSWLLSPLGTQFWQTLLLPIVQPKPGSVIRPLSNFLIHGSNTGSVHLDRKAQGVSLLHLDYGLDLDQQVASQDPFYALNELFALVAFSENQFLNMLDNILRAELDAEKLAHQQNPTLSNLLYNSQVLDRHIEHIKDTLRIINSNKSTTWPKGKVSSDLLQKASVAQQSLVADYEYLLSKSLFLSEKCLRGMQVVMNNTMIMESEKAIAQAERVQKLTRLAFIFTPLSFTASFFGMNFLQFGQGTLNIWLWFAVSCPVLAVSIFLMRDDALSFPRFM